jgi:hypothetical protein
MSLPFSSYKEVRKHYRIPRILLYSLFGTILTIWIVGCAENDDVPPVITLNGPDTLVNILNLEYNDPGATAVDETDGDLTSNIFVDNQVDEDRVGEYTVTYWVVDNAGNEAPEVSRIVYVANEALPFLGEYSAAETQIFPASEVCNYPVFIWQDSTVNNRIIFFDFACNSQRPIYADISDTLLIVPFQVVQDSIVDMSIQGSGIINDSLAYIEYTRIDSLGSALWQATFNRVK